MRIARLEFFGMYKLVEIEDSTKYYELRLPLQPTDKYTMPKENVESPEEPEYGKLIFIVTGNDRFGYFEGEPTYKLIFSHFEVPK